MKAKSNATAAALRKRRFVFDSKKDVILLKACLQFNPWQFGQVKWKEINEYLKSTHNWDIAHRAAKDRLSHLIEKKTKEDDVERTGTEKELSDERAQLISEVIALIAENATPIEKYTTAEEADLDLEPDEVDSKIKEKKIADMEREIAISSLARDPPSNKAKRVRLTPQDEIMKMKIEHDMMIEKERVRLEEQKQTQEFNLESKKLSNEEARLAIELKREDRLLEESKRSACQIELQTKMLEMIMKKQ